MYQWFSTSNIQIRHTDQRKPYSHSKIYTVYSTSVNSSCYWSKESKCTFYISSKKHFHFALLRPEVLKRN